MPQTLSLALNYANFYFSAAYKTAKFLSLETQSVVCGAMFKLAVFLAFLPLTLSASSSRIIGGQAVKDAGEFPWMADLSVQYRGDRWSHLCGGAVIHYKYIISAAHCAQFVLKK